MYTVLPIVWSHITVIKVTQPAYFACTNIKNANIFTHKRNSKYFHKNTLSAQHAVYLVNSRTFNSSYLSSCPNWRIGEKKKVRINAKTQPKESKPNNISIDMYHDALILKLFNTARVDTANCNITPMYLQTLWLLSQVSFPWIQNEDAWLLWPMLLHLQQVN